MRSCPFPPLSLRYSASLGDLFPSFKTPSPQPRLSVLFIPSENPSLSRSPYSPPPQQYSLWAPLPFPSFLFFFPFKLSRLQLRKIFLPLHVPPNSYPNQCHTLQQKNHPRFPFFFFLHFLPLSPIQIAGTQRGYVGREFFSSFFPFSGGGGKLLQFGLLTNTASFLLEFHFKLGFKLLQGFFFLAGTPPILFLDSPI